MSDPHGEHQSIIIVKRKKHGDHGHHGGAWKIAYADFVTAMMAFFLVMWLINAANEKTRAQVASYFNPIKLTDTSTAKKGLNNPLDRTPVPPEEKAKAEPTTNSASEKAQASAVEKEKPKEEAPEPGKTGKYTDEQLFANPYGILGLLAGQAIKQLNGHSGKGLAIAENVLSQNGVVENLVDPFDPSAWKTRQANAAEQAVNDAEPKLAVEEKKEPAALKPTTEIPLPEAEVIPKPKNENVQEMKQEQVEISPPVAGNLKETVPPPKPAALPSAGDSQQALDIRNQILEKLKEFDSESVPDIDVKDVPEGVLISLTDSVNFDMFTVGSAQPQPQLVLLIEKIAQIIKSYGGEVVVRGHTDARPFKSGGNDNWRLSASRAQMAFYMMVRAGLDEKKVERIEGYADHDLKFPDKPEYAGNRRIEILLKAKAK
jgi:chemotaxis protein MotB